MGGVAREPPADGAGAGICASCGSHNWPSWSCELCTATGCVSCLNLVPYLSSMMCPDCHDKQREADERPVASLAGLEQELPESSSSDQDSDEDSEDELGAGDAAAEALASRTIAARKAAGDPGGDMFQHVGSRVVHLTAKGPEPFLACGRRLSDRYEKLGASVHFGWPRCRQCVGFDSGAAASRTEQPSESM